MKRLLVLLITLAIVMGMAVPAYADSGSGVDVSGELDAAMAYLVRAVPNPALGSVGGEWAVLALARSGYSVPSGYYEGYYNRIVQEVQTKYAANGWLDGNKPTEEQRLTIALVAIGKDPRNVGGYNLLNRMADYNNVIKQGDNSTNFALIALDTAGFAIPGITDPSRQATREKYVDRLLENQANKLNGSIGIQHHEAGNVDSTAMALQALARYRDLPGVEDGIEWALDYLSDVQMDDGSYSFDISLGDEGSNVESCAQVLVALTALGIDPTEDTRFIKYGFTVIDAMLRFQQSDGSFRHIMSGSGNNLMASEQAAYALAAYDRFVKKQNSLYDMTDAFDPDNPIDPEPEFIRGDINNDSYIDAADVVFLRRYLLKRVGYDFSPSMDVNNDNFIDSADVVYLSRYILKRPGYTIDP